MSSGLMRTLGFLLLSASVVLKPSLGHAEDAPSWETVLEAERLRLVSDAIQRLHPGASREHAIVRFRAQGLLPRGLKDSLLLRVLDEWTFKVGVGASVRDEFRRGDRLGDLHAYTGALVRIQLLFDDRGVIKGKSWAVGSDAAVVMPHHAPEPRSVSYTSTGETDAPVVASPAWIGLRKPRPGAEADFVQVAKALDFLDWGDVVYGRNLEVRPPARNRIERNQVVLSWLLSVAHPLADLVTLSRHEHPRVRTLALVALVETESPHALPAIVARLDDDAPTLGRHALWSDYRVSTRINTVPMVKTTVGDVAGALLDSWLAKAGTSREGWKRYWAQRKHRSHCVGWMAVRLNRRAHASPIPKAQYPKIRALYKEALLLPPVDRELTILAVFSESAVSSLVGREEVLAAGPRLGLDNLRALARGEVITDDPDFQPVARGWSSDYQKRVRWLILQNADTWLRPSDADLVLKMGRGMRSPLGAVKAGKLAPERAKALLEAAWEEWEESSAGPFKSSYKRFKILKGMWDQLGDTQGDLIVDWYHSEYDPELRASTPIHDLPEFLLQRGAKRDLRLLKKIVMDERFDRVEDEMTLTYLLIALNQFLEAKLGGVEQIYSSDIRGRAAHWRDVFRKTMRTHLRFRDL